MPPPVITLKKKKPVGVPQNPFSVKLQAPKASPSPSSVKAASVPARPAGSSLRPAHPVKSTGAPGTKRVKLEEEPQVEEAVGDMQFDEGDFDEPMEVENAEEPATAVSAAVQPVKEEPQPEPIVKVEPKTEPTDKHSALNPGMGNEIILKNSCFFFSSGIVYLFGKVWIESAKAHVSCCVVVKNIERTMYLLPRETRVNLKTRAETDTPVTMMDVYQEFNEIADRYKIMKFKSKKVVKNYAFDIPDVPAQSEYLEVRYSADLPPLPQDLKGATFSQVFGTNTTSLEHFLLGRKIKGPCWLDVKTPQLASQPVSWCKVEAVALKSDLVSVVKDIAAPPLVVLSISMKTVQNPKTHQNEIVSLAALLHNQFPLDRAPPQPPFQTHFCVISKPNDCIYPFDFNEAVKRKASVVLIKRRECVCVASMIRLPTLLSILGITDPNALYRSFNMQYS
ncbi:UNVERIFIED_CONTAM: hypothetical protein FKN15_024321 [Acipenser sinensis]